MVQNCSMWFNVVQFVSEPHFLKIGAKLQKICEMCKFFVYRKVFSVYFFAICYFCFTKQWSY